MLSARFSQTMVKLCGYGQTGRLAGDVVAAFDGLLIIIIMVAADNAM